MEQKGRKSSPTMKVIRVWFAIIWEFFVLGYKHFEITFSKDACSWVVVALVHEE
jgi:hypothetical protein